jgi:hypothetical protein
MPHNVAGRMLVTKKGGSRASLDALRQLGVDGRDDDRLAGLDRRDRLRGRISGFSAGALGTAELAIHIPFSS